MKPLIIGEAPSKNEHVPRPISGRIGRRLAACCNLTLEQFLEAFDRVNLLDVRQDTREKGFEFDLDAARIEANKIRRVLSFPAQDGKLVILLGKRVARAFEADKFDWFEEFRIGARRAFVVPHPSGVSRWWNEPENERRMYDFMQSMMREIGR